MSRADDNYFSDVPDSLSNDDREIDEVALVLPDSEEAEDDPNAIRAEIAETRDRMSSTLDEIGERLNPHRVTEQVKDSIREATIGRVEDMAQQAADRVGDAKRSVVDTIRENPVPSAMVALGLGWMMWNGRSESRSAESQYARTIQSGRGRGHSTSRVSGGYNGGGYATTGYGDYTGNPADANTGDSGVVDTIRDKAGALGSTVRDTAGGLADRAQDVASTVADSVTQGTRTSARRVEDTFYENPLLTGAVTLALGLAAGLAAPRTHPEVALMGDARDQAEDRVRGLVQDTKQKAEHVAERVVNEAKSAAHDEGLAAPSQ